MKKHFWIILFVVIFSIGLTADNKGNITITYDYSINQIKNDNDSMFSIWYGRNLTFNVININPFDYKVTINGQGMDYYKNEIPKSFSDLTKKVYENSVDSTKIEEAVATKGEKVRSTVNTSNLRSKAPSAILNLPPFKISDITQASRFIFAVYQDFYNKILQNKSCKEIKEDIVESYVQIRKIYNQEGIIKDPSQVTTGNIPGELSIINAIMADRVSAISGQIGDNDELGKDIEKLGELVRLNIEMIAAISKANTKLTDANFQKSIVFPTVDVDYFQVTVKVEPISAGIEVPYQVIDPITIKVKRGWKIDFSTGMQFVLNAEAQSYILENTSADPTRVQIKRAYDRYSIKPTANVLMHVHVRTRRSLNWGGILFGFGTNDAEGISYFFGTGLMIGTKNRFIFNCGVALQKVTILKPQFTEGQILAADTEVTPENLLYEAIKPRLFFGISYNLSK